MDPLSMEAGQDALIADSRMARLRRINTKIRVYKDMVGVLEHQYEEVEAKIREFAVQQRASGGPARLPLMNGLVVVSKARAKVVMEDRGKMRDHFEAEFPEKFSKTVFDETAAKKSIRWIASDAGVEGALVPGVDENGAVVPGIGRYVPRESTTVAKVTPLGPGEGTPTADLGDAEAEA